MAFTEFTVIVSGRENKQPLMKVTDRWKYAEEFAYEALRADKTLDRVVITLETVEQDETGEPIRKATPEGRASSK